MIFNFTYTGCSDALINNGETGSLAINVKNKKIYYIGVNYNGLYYAEAKPDKPTDGTGEFSMGLVAT